MLKYFFPEIYFSIKIMTDVVASGINAIIEPPIKRFFNHVQPEFLKKIEDENIRNKKIIRKNYFKKDSRKPF